MSNVLIVESKNDRIFVQALIAHLNASINTVEEIKLDDTGEAIKIDEYEELSGLNQNKLREAVKRLLANAQKKPIQKLGILIDLDRFSETERIHWLNDCLEPVFKVENLFANVSEFVPIPIPNAPEISLAITCYFTQANQQGELETLLKHIKAQPSPYADCLEDWRNCLAERDYDISDKEFDKFWIAQYLRYDTCSKKEQKQAERKCSMKAFDYIMKHKAEIWNFDHPVLTGIKQFLSRF